LNDAVLTTKYADDLEYAFMGGWGRQGSWQGRGEGFEVLDSCAWTADRETSIKKTHSTSIQCTYMESVPLGSSRCPKEPGKVSSCTSQICSNHVVLTSGNVGDIERSVEELKELAGRGGEVQVLESQWMPHTDCGLGHRHQQSTYNIFKMYVHGRVAPRVITGSN
jgi:hypothetical protein